jgi:hypothetical protein
LSEKAGEGCESRRGAIGEYRIFMGHVMRQMRLHKNDGTIVILSALLLLKESCPTFLKTELTEYIRFKRILFLRRLNRIFGRLYFSADKKETLKKLNLS